MIEIKFRAKAIDLAHKQFPDIYPQKIMPFVFGTGIYNDGFNVWMILENNKKLPFSQLKNEIIDINTFGQYIGIKDKYGNEIYKDDIVKIKRFKDEYVGKVVLNEKTCGFEIWYSTVEGAYGEKAIHKINFSNANYDEIKILGNIHDNPELLKKYFHE